MKEKEKSEIKFLPITDLEKVNLKNKIFNSVRRHKTKKSRTKYFIGIAASIMLLLTAGYFQLTKPKESLHEFVKTAKDIDVNSSDEIMLILGKGENVLVENNSEEINYSESGEEVIIGQSKSINQETLIENKIAYNTLLVPYGKRTKIKLSDGSLVWLNSGSKLVYPAVFKGDERNVYLEGEAIFDVAHRKSKPFKVISQNQEIEVLGTVFGVTSYPDDNSINTVLKSGSVQISYNGISVSKSNSDKMKITPGTIASYNKHSRKIISEKVNVDNYFSWREGYLIFRNNSLEHITRKLSRFYNLEIDIKNDELGKEEFSGYLNLNESVEEVIENIKASTEMEYYINDNKIVLN